MKCPDVKPEAGFNGYRITGMWYQASRSLNGPGEASHENGNCVQVRWDSFNESSANNAFELVSQYNNETQTIEIIREEMTMVDGRLYYFDNSTGNKTLVDLTILSTDFINFAILYNCRVDKAKNETVYYGEILTRLRNKEIMRNYNVIAHSILELDAPWFPADTMIDTNQGNDCFYLGQKPAKVII